MNPEQKTHSGAQRLRIMSMVIAGGLAILVVALFYVQIVRGAFFDQQLRRQSLRSVKLPAVRGRIFDRNNVCLADNCPSYGIALYLQELRRQASRHSDRLEVAVDAASSLSSRLGLPEVSNEAIQTHLKQKPSIPMPLWSDLGQDKIAMFEESVSSQPGVGIVVSSLRQYPLGSRAAHWLGLVGRKEDSGEDEREGYYLEPEMVGKAGMEAALDASLRGQPGGRIVQLDVLGYSENVTSEIAPQAGADVVLSMDARLQQIVETALASAPMPAGRPVRGAAVLVDVKNGDVLAMASYPTFDPNWFVRGISQEKYKELIHDSGTPLNNRATTASEPPGSIFKPFVMLAGLECGAITPDSSVECTGSVQIGGQTMRCWAHNGHGHVTAAEAMKESCDTFFYQYGMKMGVRPIKKMAEAFGFDAPTGIPLRESRGFVPDDIWLWERHHERWSDGRTANVAIGQGEVLVTPLQMAMATAALANGGVLYEPRVLLRIESKDGPPQLFEPTVKRRIAVNPEHIEWVRRTMLDVVEGRGGTGGRARVAGVKIAGKTGTAEVGPKSAQKSMAWFIAFAPFEDPQYALAVLLEDGDHGGTSAAPVAAKIFAGIWGHHYEGPEATESNIGD